MRLRARTPRILEEMLQTIQSKVTRFKHISKDSISDMSLLQNGVLLVLYCDYLVAVVDVSGGRSTTCSQPMEDHDQQLIIILTPLRGES